jgi:hypothetical protein
MSAKKFGNSAFAFTLPEFLKECAYIKLILTMKNSHNSIFIEL